MVDCAGLENRSAGNGTVGSNPTPSAMLAPGAGFIPTGIALDGRAGAPLGFESHRLRQRSIEAWSSAELRRRGGIAADR